MRTTKRFSPAVLERYSRDGRGTGVFQDYTAWHQVTRGDPTSKGRSHIMTLRGRHHDFLSDLERNFALFAWMNLRLVDLREQFPLALQPDHHELRAYSHRAPQRQFPGTQQIAQQLSIRHPVVRDKTSGDTAPWVLTTDLLATCKKGDGTLGLVALSCKYSKEELTGRQWQLLAVERAYWHARGVPWRLLTHDMAPALLVSTLNRTWHWGLISAPSEEQLQRAVSLGMRGHGLPLSTSLDRLASALGCMALAQEAFWRACWTGRLAADLRRSWRPTDPLVLIAPETFWQLNPVVVGRDAWPR